MKKLLVTTLLTISISSSAFSYTSYTTREDALGGGTTTTFNDGTTAKTTQDALGGGVTTRFSDGSVAHTHENAIGGGTTTTIDNSNTY